MITLYCIVNPIRWKVGIIKAILLNNYDIDNISYYVYDHWINNKNDRNRLLRQDYLVYNSTREAISVLKNEVFLNISKDSDKKYKLQRIDGMKFDIGWNYVFTLK